MANHSTGFLDLALETRIQIYRAVLAPSPAVAAQGYHIDDARGPTTRWRHRIPSEAQIFTDTDSLPRSVLSVAFTNRQIREEASPIYYDGRTFAFCDLQRLQWFIQDVTWARCQLIRPVSVDLDAEYVLKSVVGDNSSSEGSRLCDMEVLSRVFALPRVETVVLRTRTLESPKRKNMRRMAESVRRYMQARWWDARVVTIHTGVSNLGKTLFKVEIRRMADGSVKTVYQEIDIFTQATFWNYVENQSHDQVLKNRITQLFVDFGDNVGDVLGTIEKYEKIAMVGDAQGAPEQMERFVKCQQKAVLTLKVVHDECQDFWGGLDEDDEVALDIILDAFDDAAAIVLEKLEAKQKWIAVRDVVKPVVNDMRKEEE